MEIFIAVISVIFTVFSGALALRSKLKEIKEAYADLKSFITQKEKKAKEKITLILVAGKERYEFPYRPARDLVNRAELGSLFGNFSGKERFNLPMGLLLLNGAIDNVQSGKKDQIEIPCTLAELTRLKNNAEAILAEITA